jgi:hypothetical protein
VSDTIIPATIDLNNDSAQLVYEHSGMDVFTPTRFVIRKASGGIPAEGSTSSLIIDDTGAGLLALEIPLAGLDESNAVIIVPVTRASQLSNGQKIRARPDVEYGDHCTLTVELSGYSDS